MADPYSAKAIHESPLPKRELPPQEESGVHADEQAFEQLEQTKETFLEVAEAPVSKVTIGTTPASLSPTRAVEKSEYEIQVEKIMEEGLGALYASLPPEARPKFKQKGEQAASEISVMVRTLSVKVKRVLQLLRDWLLTIPNVNRFFLEQEAKIKTDRIVELVEMLKQDRLK